MRVCILIGGRRLLQDPLLEAVEAVRAAGGQVTTITWFPVGPAIAEATAAHIELREVDAQRRAKPERTEVKPARVSRPVHKRTARVQAGLLRRWNKLRRKAKLDAQADRVRAGLLRRWNKLRRKAKLDAKADRVRAGLLRRWNKLRRKAKFDGQAMLVHRLVSRDSRCRALLAEADILVAGDPASIRAIWYLVQRRPEIEAISGLVALRTYLSTHGAKTFSD